MSYNVRRKQLVQLYQSKKKAIRTRLGEFARVQPSEYFYELLYCLLTPQTSAHNADKAVALLKQHSFAEQAISPQPILANKAHYIRFHKTKSKNLILLKTTMPSILAALSNGVSSFELREWLVMNVKGLGYKEATHFLRNIGRNDGLAILDRHILRNLKRYGAVRTLPKTLTRKQYFSVEQRFRRFSVHIGIPIDELDLLFWSMETGEIRK